MLHLAMRRHAGGERRHKRKRRVRVFAILSEIEMNAAHLMPRRMTRLQKRLQRQARLGQRGT